MSRRIIQGINPNHEIVVGHDPGLNVFYGQVWDKAILARGGDEDEAVIAWLPFATLPTPEALANAMSNWVHIDAAMIAQLYADALQERAGYPARTSAQCTEEYCDAQADVQCDQCGEPYCRDHSWHVHVKSANGTQSNVICCRSDTQQYLSMVLLQPAGDEDGQPAREYLTVTHRSSNTKIVERLLLFQG